MSGRGAFIVLVGPDGVGKTTVAAQVIDRFHGVARYFHFRPPLRGWALPEPGRMFSPSKPTPTRVVGWLRLGVGFFRLWVAHLVAVAPAVRRGELVIGDRWAYGYVAAPHDLRFGGPEWLARATIALLPRPDLVVNLTADPAEILRRKNELTRPEVERQLRAWATVPSDRLATVDSSRSPSTVAAEILSRLEARTAGRE